MSHDVGNGIRAIIASFVDGLDVTTSLHGRPHRKKRHRDRTTSDEKATNALSHSLRRSPQVIGQEYDNALLYAGPSFARGDGIAVSRLNEILLRLNTGLVNIIASFLNHDSGHEPKLDYSSLTALSDTSRRDSIGVLHQLYQRMTSARVPPRAPALKQQSRRLKDKSSRSSVQATKIRGPTIAQVTIEDSSRRPQLAIVKPTTTSRHKNRLDSKQHLPVQSPTASSATLVNSSVSSPNSRQPGPKTAPRRAAENPKLKKQVSHAAVCTKAQALQSNIKVASRSQPNLLVRTQSSWPRDSQVLSSGLQAPLPPKRITPTIYSIATDSTKLGEVPIHKRAVPYDFEASARLNAEAMQNGWPARDINGDLLVRPKKRFNWFGLRRQHITAH